MRTDVPEKLLGIIEEIDAHGHASLARLTVLKKWFERPSRLSAFAIWAARRASSRKGKTVGAAGDLFRAASRLLARANLLAPTLDRQEAQSLFDRLREFQNEYRKGQWGDVRIVQNWNLLLVEQGLEIYLGHADSPADGYKLAADYCRHYDPQHGNGLAGPSRARIQEIVRFLFRVEALEEE